jgi:hypothetical protein
VARQLSLLGIERRVRGRPVASYVPVLLNKKGELDALSQASKSVWDAVVPLLCFAGPKPKPNPRPLRAETLRQWVKRAHVALRDHPCLLDIVRLNATHPVSVGAGGSRPALEYLLAEAKAQGLAFAPVLPTECSVEQQEMVVDAAFDAENGLALRHRLLGTLPPVGKTHLDVVRSALEAAEHDPAVVDLLLDLSYLSEDVDVDVRYVAELARMLSSNVAWRSVVLIGTSIPSTMASISEGHIEPLARREWDLWTEVRDHIRAESGLAPAFGDYAVQHPKPPLEGGGGPGMRANIRYTTGGITLVARGVGPANVNPKSQYRELCRAITARREYAGPTYSWGDRVLFDCAHEVIDAGGQEMWLFALA